MILIEIFLVNIIAGFFSIILKSLSPIFTDHRYDNIIDVIRISKRT